MRIPFYIPLFAAAGLAACMAEAPGPVDQPNDTGCGAPALQSLVGQPVNAVDLTGHDPLRILPPGSVMTMDYNPNRLNVMIDEAGIITRLQCG